jgi:hypothetical protein
MTAKIMIGTSKTISVVCSENSYTVEITTNIVYKKYNPKIARSSNPYLASKMLNNAII